MQSPLPTQNIPNWGATPSNVFSGIDSSTPSSQSQGAIGNLAQNFIAGRIDRGTSSPNGTPITTTPSGGTSFPAQSASGYSAPVTPATPATAPQGLGQYINNTNQTPSGTIQSTGGQVVGYNPSNQYNIDTSGAIPSTALTSGTSSGDIAQTHSSYQDYINALGQAQGYSPDYVAAQTGVYNAQAQGAALGVAGAAAGNQAFGNNQANNGNGTNFGNLGGATTDYVGGVIGSEQSQNALRQAQNTQQQTSANIALNAQQLQRTGNIAAAQTQLQYNPTAVSGENAINQYNALQQQYPNAAIPAYNTALSPATNQQIAQELVSNSPAYRAQFQSTYATPGGGTGIYSKLDVTGLQQNQDGSYTLVPAAAAALGSANAAVVNSSLSNLSTINSAIDSSTKTLATTQNFMNQYGLNQSDVPIINQIQNSTNKQLPKAGAIAALNVDLNTLRSDYSQFLIGRGGSIAGTGPDSSEVMQAIPDNVSPDQLQTIVNQMQVGGQNTATAVNAQVQQALQGISNNSISTNSGSTGGSGWGSLGD